MQDSEEKRIWIDSIAKARAVDNEFERVVALTNLAQSIPDEFKDELLGVVHLMSDDDAKAKALTELVLHLPERLKAQALDEALGIKKPSASAQALCSLATHLPVELIDHALDASRKSLSEPSARVLALASLSGVLPGERRTKNLLEARKIAGKIKVAHERAEALSIVAAQLQGEPRLDVLKRAMEAAQSIDDQLVKAKTLTSIARLLPSDEASHVLEEALDLVTSLSDEALRVVGLIRLVPELPVDLIRTAWRAVKRINDDDARLEAKLKIRSILESKSIDVDEFAAQAEQAAHQEADAVKPALAIPLATRLLSDLWTFDDQFGYSIHAKAIAEFICHPATTPPLTIGILAPWGCGKTTLMRLVERHVKRRREGKDPDGDAPETKDPAPPPRTKLRDLRNWLKRPLDFSQNRRLVYPTVWFSPWRYETSDQVWAGMADCILSGLVEQLCKPEDRERFWFRLQAERLDLDAIRHDITAQILERLVPRIIVGLAGLSLGCVGVLVNILAGSATGHAGLMIEGGGLATLLITMQNGIKTYKQVVGKQLEGTFSKYVRRPDYRNKSGFLAQVEEDVRRVFKLLVDPRKPAVVFIDDLDRCSPGKVAEVIQAVNLFLSGDFPDCYFVIGMDPKVVAASIETAHSELATQLGLMNSNRGSLGWHFMEKFIQLPFIIPTLSEYERNEYLVKLFCTSRSDGHSGSQTSELVPVEIQRLNEVVQKADSANALVERVETEIRRIREAMPGRLPDQWRQHMQITAHRAIEVASQLFSDDDPEIESQLRRFSPYLMSPRNIKRFANLYRFYRHSHWSRRVQGLEAASPAALGRWVLVMLRWPHLIRWIQSSEETELVNANNSTEKADELEKMMRSAKSYEAWIKTLKSKKVEKPQWANDRELFKFIGERNGMEERLSRAIELALW